MIQAQSSPALDRDESIPTYAQLADRPGYPSGSSWGVFGDSDEHGTLNFLTEDSAAAAAAGVSRGAVFNLDYPPDRAGAHRL